MLWGLVGLMGKMKMPDAASALPGRQERMPVPGAHFVNGHPLEPPYPDGMEKAVFGLGCFWGAERCFWQLDGVYTTAVGYGGGITPNPTYEEVCTGRTGHNEVVLVVFDPTVVSYGELLRVFWEAHDPTQGMRQGNDVGTQYRSGIYTYGDEQKTGRRGVTGTLPGRSVQGGVRPHHDGDPGRRGVLLRRGLPPAVSRQEPVGVLRAGRHRGELPGGVTACIAAEPAEGDRRSPLPLGMSLHSLPAAGGTPRVRPCPSYPPSAEFTGATAGRPYPWNPVGATGGRPFLIHPAAAG